MWPCACAGARNRGTTGLPPGSSQTQSSARISNTVRSISGSCCNAASTARTSALCSTCVCGLIRVSGIFLVKLLVARGPSQQIDIGVSCNGEKISSSPSAVECGQMPSTRAQTCLTLSHPPSPYRRTSTMQIGGHHRHSVRRGPRFPSFLIATQVTSEHSKGYIERNPRRLIPKRDVWE